MINVDWSEAPEGATEIVRHRDNELRWANSESTWSYDCAAWVTRGDAWKVIASRPTERKTVKDAVEFYKGEWPKSHSRYEHMIYSGNGFVFGSEGRCIGTEYQVCTRDEFEAEVERQKGEWTHVDLSGEECRLLSEYPDLAGFIPVMWSSGHYGASKPDQLKPITTKPTITKAQAFDKLNAVPGVTLEELHDKFIVEGTA